MHTIKNQPLTGRNNVVRSIFKTLKCKKKIFQHFLKGAGGGGGGVINQNYVSIY